MKLDVIKLDQKLVKQHQTMIKKTKRKLAKLAWVTVIEVGGATEVGKKRKSR